MNTLVRTENGYKLSVDTDKKVVHHTDGDWDVLKENKNCYLLTQKLIFSVRTKDSQGRVGFYTGDSSSMAYHIFNQIGEMDMRFKYINE